MKEPSVKQTYEEMLLVSRHLIRNEHKAKQENQVGRALDVPGNFCWTDVDLRARSQGFWQ